MVNLVGRRWLFVAVWNNVVLRCMGDSERLVFRPHGPPWFIRFHAGASVTRASAVSAMVRFMLIVADRCLIDAIQYIPWPLPKQPAGREVS